MIMRVYTHLLASYEFCYMMSVRTGDFLFLWMRYSSCACTVCVAHTVWYVSVGTCYLYVIYLYLKVHSSQPWDHHSLRPRLEPLPPDKIPTMAKGWVVITPLTVNLIFVSYFILIKKICQNLSLFWLKLWLLYYLILTHWRPIMIHFWNNVAK